MAVLIHLRVTLFVRIWKLWNEGLRWGAMAIESLLSITVFVTGTVPALLQLL